MTEQEQQLNLALSELEEDLFHAMVCAEQAKRHYIAVLVDQARRKILVAQRSLEIDEQDEDSCELRRLQHQKEQKNG